MFMELSNWKQKFAIIWTGQFFSLLTSSIVNFAIILWLSIETGSAQVLAFAAIAALLPQSLIGPFTGVLVDRWNRKYIMILSDSFIALCTLILAVLFYFDIKGIGYIYILLALRSVGSAFHMPAMQSSIPLLAPKSELTRIAGINQAIQSVSTIAGPALGALFISLFDIGIVVLVDVAGAALACISLLFVSIPDPEKTHTEKLNVFKEIKEAISIVKSIKGLQWLFFFSLISTFCIMPISVLFPLMTLEHFSGSAFEISIIEVVWGIGMLIGGAIMGIKRFSINQVVLLNSMYLILGISFALSGLLPKEGFILFAVLTTLGGISAAIYSSSFTAIIQKNIDPSVLGRVFSMYISVTLLPSLIGLTGTGFVADYIGLTAVFVILGLIIFIIGIISLLLPSLYNLGKE